MTLEDEKTIIIAKFIGYFQQDLISDDGYLGWWSAPDNLSFPNHEYKQIMFSAMRFNSSMEWLRLAIKKITDEHMCYFKLIKDIEYGHVWSCSIFHPSMRNSDITNTDKDDIKAVTNSILGFIEWINKTNNTLL